MKRLIICSALIFLLGLSTQSLAQQLPCSQVPGNENPGDPNFDGCVGSGQLPLGNSTNHNFLTGGPGSGNIEILSDGSYGYNYDDFRYYGSNDDPSGSCSGGGSTCNEPPPGGFCMEGSSGCGSDGSYPLNPETVYETYDYYYDYYNYGNGGGRPPPSNLSPEDDALFDEALENDDFMDHVGNETDYNATSNVTTTDADVVALYKTWIKENGGNNNQEVNGSPESANLPNTPDWSNLKNLGIADDPLGAILFPTRPRNNDVSGSSDGEDGFSGGNETDEAIKRYLTSNPVVTSAGELGRIENIDPPTIILITDNSNPEIESIMDHIESVIVID